MLQGVRTIGAVRAIVGVLAFALCFSQCVAASLPLEQVADIRLPGNATRLDYQSLDAGKHLLFIAHLGDSQVIAIDTQARRVVATVANVSAVHGVLAVPQLNTVYASATGTNEVVAIDETTFRIKARMPGGVYPDGIAFDPENGRLYVSDEHGDTDTVLDTRANRRIATIPVGGDVGNTQYDTASRHIFVNVQTTGNLVEIDPLSNRIINRIALTGCEGNHGLLIDAPKRRAFIACEDNAAFVWLDMRSGRVVREWSIGTDPDVLALDPGTHKLYVAAESGVVSIFADGTSVSRIGQAYLAPAAHTVAVDPRTHLVYFPLENVDGAPVLRVMRTAQCHCASASEPPRAFCDVTETSRWKMTTSDARKYPGRFVVHAHTIESEPGQTWGVDWCNEPLPADFVLRIEWLRHENNDNSGVFIRFPNPDTQHEPNNARIAARGFEI